MFQDNDWFFFLEKSAGQRQPQPPGVRRRPLGGHLPNGLTPNSATADRKEEAYDLARRSLKLWPMSREGELRERTVEFLVNELRLDQQHATGLNLVVKRVGSAVRSRLATDRPSNVRDEVLVHFKSARERDDVRTFAKNLEKKVRGLRLEIPDHLWPSFRVLQQLGYELKQRNPALRRNILFDDENRDLKMDISTDSTTWKTVLPDHARKSLQRCRPARQRRVSVSREELDSLLGPMEADSETRMDEGGEL